MICRRDAQLGAGLYDEIVVDLFAGGGGASVGIEAALGRCVDVAVNHDPEAVAMHRVNHPHTLHYTADVFEVDPLEATGGRPVGLLWASPDCTYFSKARGAKPIRHKSRKRRALAWVVVKWARAVKPRVIMLENVEEFAEWGPLTSEGRPCPDRRGRTFARWVALLKAEGYAVEWRVLRACDYGAPTIRKRLFLVARCDGEPINWPEVTHGVDTETGGRNRTNGRAHRAARPRPFRTAAECIDWSIPCPSIFERKRPLAEATLRRIARGIVRYVIEAAEPFIVGAGGPAYSGKPQSVEQPFGTIMTENHRAVVVPSFVSTNHGDSGGRRSYPADEPMRTVCASSRGGEALVAAFLTKHFGGTRQQMAVGLDRPMPTIVSRATQTQLTAAHLMKLRGTCRDGQDLREPAPTVTSGGNHAALVAALLIKFYGNEREGLGLACPLHTITTKDRFGLVMVTIAGETYVICDIGMRMLQPHELYAAQGFPRSYIHAWGLSAEGRRVAFTKTAQVRLCGNSVAPPVPEALVRANFTTETQSARATRSTRKTPLRATEAVGKAVRT